MSNLRCQCMQVYCIHNDCPDSYSCTISEQPGLPKHNIHGMCMSKVIDESIRDTVSQPTKDYFNPNGKREVADAPDPGIETTLKRLGWTDEERDELIKKMSDS